MYSSAEVLAIANEAIDRAYASATKAANDAVQDWVGKANEEIPKIIAKTLDAKLPPLLDTFRITVAQKLLSMTPQDREAILTKWADETPPE